jgi:hypothetical protein
MVNGQWSMVNGQWLTSIETNTNNYLAAPEIEYRTYMFAISRLSNAVLKQ